MKEKFYVTTTIPYANAPPHIGFALELVQADVLARWNSLIGKETFLLTGTDEHGQKNFQTAKKKNLEVSKFVSKNSAFFRELADKLNINYTYFIRTTDKKVHWPGVLELWKLLEKNGDIYKKKYAGNYCSGCERFITDKDLVDGKCPNHPKTEIQKISEENYFFKLSNYSDKIIKLIKNDELEIFPKIWKNNFLGLIKESGGLKDVSFSRENEHLPWGVPVPGDNNQVMYVWCDALTNYLTGVGYPNKKFEKYWPADVHAVGKDMLRFHAGIWPGMLLSANLELPKKIIVHGFLTVGGKKMSKSVGNVVAPLELLEKYSADAIRYYLCRNFVFGQDGDFSEQALKDRHNNELADKLGNLISRVSGLIEKFGMAEFGDQNFEQTDLAKRCLINFEKSINNFEFDKALNEVFHLIDKSNAYAQNEKPWENNDRHDRLEINQGVLYNLSQGIKMSTILLWPFIPETSEKIAKHFGFEINYNNIHKSLDINKINKTKIKILFEKIK